MLVDVFHLKILFIRNLLLIPERLKCLFQVKPPEPGNNREIIEKHRALVPF